MEPAAIAYEITIAQPESHDVQVCIRVPAEGGGTRDTTVDQATFVMPAWTPGSYTVRDFARNVYGVCARDKRGAELPVERVDKQSWRVDSGGRAFSFHYTVFAFENTVRTSYVDADRAFINGTSVLMYRQGSKDKRCTLAVRGPRGWPVVSPLKRLRGGRFEAADYDTLVDAPLGLGGYTTKAFREQGARFEIAWSGVSNADPARVVAGIKRIVAATGRLFGGFPFSRYVFFIHAVPKRGGGLEHLDACTCNVEAFSFGDERGWHNFFSLIAHEFFHAWNVKRIRDKVLGPFDYTKECYTELLWLHEGFTVFMEDEILRDAGLLSVDKFLEQMSADLTRYEQRGGRDVTPLSELSFEAWVKQYSPPVNFSDRAISYYEKGRWLGQLLELKLRQKSNGKRGVRHLFVRLWKRYGEKGRGITHADAVQEASVLAGVDLTRFFERYARGVEPLPLRRALLSAGLDVSTSPLSTAFTDSALSDSQEGGGRRPPRAPVWLGVSLKPKRLMPAGDQAALIGQIHPGGPAETAGLAYGDEIVALDGARVRVSNFEARVRDFKVGHAVTVTIFRDDRLRRVTVVATRDPRKRYRFTLAARPSSEQRAIRKGWLSV